MRRYHVVRVPIALTCGADERVRGGAVGERRHRSDKSVRPSQNTDTRTDSQKGKTTQTQKEKQDRTKQRRERETGRAFGVWFQQKAIVLRKDISDAEKLKLAAALI